MNTQPEESIFSELFKEGATDILNAVADNRVPKDLEIEKDKDPGSIIPFMPSLALDTSPSLKTFWRGLRSFFRSGKGGGISATTEDRFNYPALLAPYRTRLQVERSYPFWVDANADDETLRFSSLKELLLEHVGKFAPSEGDAKPLKDNLLRLENLVRNRIAFVNDAFSFYPVMAEAMETLETQLSLSGKDGEMLSNALENLRKHLPRTGLLLPHVEDATLYLFSAVVKNQLSEPRKVFQESIRQLSAQLKDILFIEKAKRPEAHSEDKLHNSYDFADGLLDFNTLSSLIPESGTVAMPEDRLKRIEKVLQTLEFAEERQLTKQAVFVIAEHDDATQQAFGKIFSQSEIVMAPVGKSCLAATEVFDMTMSSMAEVFAAFRIANLEVANQYDLEIHNDFFNSFDWRSFSKEELAVCPPVFFVNEDRSILNSELDAFSKLLASNRPVNALVWCKGHGNESEVSRQELGSIAVAHRNAYVAQLSSNAPAILLQAFQSGIASFVPSLFYIFSPQTDEQSLSSQSLWSSAAIEGRAFPGFIYDIQKGERWGSRFNIQHNPNHSSDWPEHELTFLQEGQEKQLQVSFTFADFAAQCSALSGHFKVVPPQYWTDDLVLLADYLSLPSEKAYAKVPYIWMVNEKNELQKVAASWQMVRLCQERLDFWHFLQENAGIHSYHVELATEKLKKELAEEATRKLAELTAKYEQELIKARDEAAGKAMEHLAAVLLDIDTSPAALAPVKASQATARPAESAEKIPHSPSEKIEPAPFAPPAAMEELVIGEPWIESDLCTSCNECINLNKRMFKYNASKQAYISDPKLGTFAELVKAAEKCPVAIIHPGAPLNPNEPGLEALKKRAEKFN